MRTLGHAAVWLTVFVFAVASMAAWTAVAFLLTNWLWHTMAIGTLVLVLLLAIVTCHEHLTRLRRQAAQTAIPDGRVEMVDLRRILGEETYEELSQLEAHRVSE